MALLILLNNTLCLMNMLVLVWLLWPLSSYYRGEFYSMTKNAIHDIISFLGPYETDLLFIIK